MPSFADILPYLAILGGSYLLGSIPVGLLVGKLTAGVDLRNFGSGRTGATNALRVLGARRSAVVLVADLAKGLLPVMVAAQAIGTDLAQVVAGLGALVGHNWSIYIGLRGGRGVSTGFGALLGMAPLAAAVTLAVGATMVALSRYVSLGSVVGAVAGSAALVGLVLTGARTPAYLTYAFLASGIVIFSHRDNIQRLLSGTERRLGERATMPPSSPSGGS